MIESFTFSSQGLAEDQAFDLYRRLYSGGANVARGPGQFQAELKAWRLDRLIVFDRLLGGVSHERPAPRVENDGFSHFTVTLVIDGELVGTSASGFDRVGPGQIVLQDMRRPARHHVATVHLVTVSVARDLIEAAAGSANGLHGRFVEPAHGGLLADYMKSLTRRAPGQ
jgi:AraC-binding-like domain